MQILAVSDFHNSRQGAAAVRKVAEDRRPDVVAIAGDLTNCGPPEFARGLLASLPVTALVVPGNLDTGEVGEVLSTGKAQNIHLRRETVGGVPFVGLGGWIAHPALEESWGIDPRAAESEISSIMPENAVLLTHVPPYGHLDGVPVPAAFAGGFGEKEHIGSPMVLRLVEKFRPRLVISGHVHEDRGIERSKGTLFVNPGPARNGFGAIITVEASVRAQLISWNQVLI